MSPATLITLFTAYKNLKFVSTGITVPVEANVAVAILVLPLNSALNPFLYTLNVVRDKLAARQEERLLQKVKRQLVLQYISGWIKDKTISASEVLL